MGCIDMKNLHLLIWLTQLGLSTAAPLAGFVLLAVWLKNRFGLGNWVLFVGIGLGVYSAIDGLIHSLRTLDKLSKRHTEKEDRQSLSYNDHQ